MQAHTHTDRRTGDYISLPSFLERRLKLVWLLRVCSASGRYAVP
jgi:hypothetical protein